MRKKPQFPEEMLEEILVRLQVVDLLRFKSVCKLWHSVISRTHFIQLHLKKSKATPSHHRILTTFNKSLMKTIDCSDLYDREVVINNLPKPCKTEVTFLGTCDGLVSYYNKRTKSICVWNPAMRVSKSLKTFETLYRGISFYWFGRDDDEYKLVMGTSSSGHKNFIHLIRPYADGEVSNWKSTQEFREGPCVMGFGTLFNGRLHWAANDLSLLGRNDFGNPAFRVFSYDLRGQTVAELLGRKPTVAGRKLEFATMCVINGCLYAVHRTLQQNKPIFEVWMMKEYGVKDSWTRLTTILSDIDVRRCHVDDYPFLCVVEITDSGDMIVKVESTHLLICNIAESKSRTLMANREGRQVMYVVESLVFPSGVGSQIRGKSLVPNSL